MATPSEILLQPPPSPIMPTAWVCFPGADYTHQAALRAARSVLGPQWLVIEGTPQVSETEHVPQDCDAYIADYDLLPFETLLGTKKSCSSYVIRKALIRKHYLANAVHAHCVKNAGFVAKIPRTWFLDIQFADELDELLADDLYDLRDALEHNETDTDEKSWFILKPGMADQANGIRLFSSLAQLRDIFEDMEEPDEADESQENGGDQDGVFASQLRHFVIQDYLTRPVLVSPQDPNAAPRKFHLRAYVTCVGGLQVYLHDDMLALFTSQAYTEPKDDEIDLRQHLSNTCYGARHTEPEDGMEGNVFLWRQLVGQPMYLPSGGRSVLSQTHVDRVHELCVQTIGSTFAAVAKEASIHWQMWPNAFEVFGVDLMVTCASEGSIDNTNAWQVWLLEINAVRGLIELTTSNRTLSNRAQHWLPLSSVCLHALCKWESYGTDLGP